MSDTAPGGHETAIGVDAGAWCEDFSPYLGRPINLVRFSANPTADGRTLVQVTVRIHRADREGWQDHNGQAADLDPTIATGRAVVHAVHAADPVAVMLWDLQRQGHLIAARVSDASGDRRTIGAEVDVERLERLGRTVPSSGRVGVRTRRAAYRAVSGPALRLAISIVDHPSSITAADEHLGSLPPELTRSVS